MRLRELGPLPLALAVFAVTVLPASARGDCGDPGKGRNRVGFMGGMSGNEARGKRYGETKVS